MDSKEPMKVMLSHTKANIRQRVQPANQAWTLDQSGNKQGIIVYSELRKGEFRKQMKEVCPTLVSRTGLGGNNIPSIIVDSDSSGRMTSTSMPQQSTIITSKKLSNQQTLGKWIPNLSQTSTSSVLDFLARASRMLDSGEGLKTQGGLSFSKFAESLGIKDHLFCSLRTSKGSLITIQGKHFEPSSNRWMNLGMTYNGKCLTVDGLEFHRIENESSLSGILEDNPDPKYFLSEKAVKGLVRHQLENEEKGKGFSTTLLTPSRRGTIKEVIS